MSDQDVEHDQLRGRLPEISLAIYTSITLLGVIAAASWKGLFADDMELLVIIAGTTVTLAIAHLWATVAAHRLTHRRPLTPDERRHELRNAVAVLIVGTLAIVVLAISWRLGAELETSIRLTLGMMIAVLFVVGVVGARRSGGSWLHAIGWGMADASIGIIVLILKILVGG